MAGTWNRAAASHLYP